MTSTPQSYVVTKHVKDLIKVLIMPCNKEWWKYNNNFSEYRPLFT